jgi:hypothetical protein
VVIVEPLGVGEMLALTHPYFTRSSSLSNRLTVGGNGSGLFSGTWRDSDNIYDLQLGERVLLLGDGSGDGSSGSLGSEGDRSSLTVNLTLPFIEGGGVDRVIVSSVPRVLSVLLTGAGDVLYAGDSVFILVTFDESVQVLGIEGQVRVRVKYR